MTYNCVKGLIMENSTVTKCNNARPDPPLKVGSRKDSNPSILEIDDERTQKDGLLFWKEANIYLSKEIPPQYLSVFK